MYNALLNWGPTLLVVAFFFVGLRWTVSRYARLFATQAENARAQTAATLRLAEALDRITAALEKKM
jgi:hypothetical protein